MGRDGISNENIFAAELVAYIFDLHCEINCSVIFVCYCFGSNFYIHLRWEIEQCILYLKSYLQRYFWVLFAAGKWRWGKQIWIIYLYRSIFSTGLALACVITISWNCKYIPLPFRDTETNSPKTFATFEWISRAKVFNVSCYNFRKAGITSSWFLKYCKKVLFISSSSEFVCL